MMDNIMPLLLAGGSFGLALAGTISGFVYLIIRLVTNPIQEDLNELKPIVERMASQLKSDAELQRLIDLKIAEHKMSCISGAK